MVTYFTVELEWPFVERDCELEVELAAYSHDGAIVIIHMWWNE